MPLLLFQIYEGTEDIITIKSEENTDTLNMMFESVNQVREKRFDCHCVALFYTCHLF